MIDHDRQPTTSRAGIVSGKSFTSIRVEDAIKFGHHGRERPRRRERHAAAIVQLPIAEKMVEAEIPDTKTIHSRRSAGEISASATATRRKRSGLLERIEHGGIVAAMRAALHQHAAGKPDRVQHTQIFLQRRIRWRIAAIPV